MRGVRLAALLALAACGGKPEERSAPALSAPEPARFGSNAPVEVAENTAANRTEDRPVGPALPLGEGRRSSEEEFAASLGSDKMPAAPQGVTKVEVVEARPAPPPSRQAAPAAAKALLYTNLSWCAHCRVLEAKLQTKPKLRERFQEAGDSPPDGGGIPALFVNGRMVRGPDAIIAALERL